MKKRLFLALPLPEKFKEELILYQKEMAGNFDLKERKPRITKAENLHITVSFLGSVEEKIIPRILEIIETITAKFLPFVLEFSEVSGVPARHVKKMIWAIFHDSAEFVELKINLEKELSKLVPLLLREKGKEIVIHVTLARLKNEGIIESLPFFETLNAKIICEKLILFESRLTGGGPVYNSIRDFSLNSHLLPMS